MGVMLLAAVVLAGTHSHNDYERPRPLLDALDHGFDSVEADLFLVDGVLLVGHNRKDLKPERTFESMYVKPLAERLKANGGWVYKGVKHRVWVLVDIKADGTAVYAAFKKLVAKYPEIKPQSLRFIISGDRPIAEIVKDKGRFAALDGRWSDLAAGYSAELMPWVSEDWSSHFKWNGSGPFEESAQLSQMTAEVRKQHRMLRFWGAADGPEMWKIERAAGVYWLNSDHPAELQEWIMAQHPITTSRPSETTAPIREVRAKLNTHE